MRCELYLVRHGAAVGNADGRYLGLGSDPPLTDRGRQQARAAGRWLGRHFSRCSRRPAPDVVFTSGLRRADETAWIMSRVLGAGVRVDERLGELDFGSWEGITYREAKSSCPKRLRRWYDDPVNNAPPAGESLQQLGRRVRSACGELTRRYAHRALVVVSHGGPIRALLASACGGIHAPAAFAERFFSGECPTGSVSLVLTGLPPCLWELSEIKFSGVEPS